MQRVTVLYPNAADTKFDFDDYLNERVPWVARLVGQSIELRRGLSSLDGARAPFVCVATIFVDTVEVFQTIFAKHAKEIVADIPNYTNSQPILQIDEVVRSA